MATDAAPGEGAMMVKTLHVRLARRAVVAWESRGFDRRFRKCRRWIQKDARDVAADCVDPCQCDEHHVRRTRHGAQWSIME
eukprot:scaffold5777_cov41-Tisochrysis_lutea.AAC.1